MHAFKNVKKKNKMKKLIKEYNSSENYLDSNELIKNRMSRRISNAMKIYEIARKKSSR